MSAHGVDEHQPRPAHEVLQGALSKFIYETNEDLIDLAENDADVRRVLENYEKSMLIEFYVDLISSYRTDRQFMQSQFDTIRHLRQFKTIAEQTIAELQAWKSMSDIEQVDLSKSMAFNCLPDKTQSNKNPYIVKG